MRLKPLAVVGGIVCLIWPGELSACPAPFLYGPLLTPAKMDIMPGIVIEPQSPTGTVIGGNVGIKLGSKAVLRPGAALCKVSSFSAVLFGAGAGLGVWQDAAGKVAIAAVAGLSYYTKEGESDMVIPLGAVADFKTSDKVSLFGGAGIQMERFSFDAGPVAGDVSETDSDPFLQGGAVLKLNTMDLILGLLLKLGEGGTDTALNFGLRIPIGS
jgi:hypothetical protein